MPTIKITDTQSVEIDTVSVDPNPLTAAIAKYVTSPAALIVLHPDLVKALQQPLLTAGATPLSLGFNFANTLDFSGSASPELSVAAGVKQQINVNAAPGSNLIPAGLFGSPIVVGAGEGWLSVALSGTVDVGLTGGSGNVTFGIDVGGGVGTEYFRRFDVNAAHPTVAEAFGTVISDFTLPADIPDLDAMQTGDICTVSGNGSLKISGDFSVSASPNPLATPDLPVINQALTLQAGATLDVGASFELKGAYQIRTRKLAPNAVELGYYRMKGTQWSVSVTASAGVTTTLGKTDLLAKLMGALTGDPSANTGQLTKAGLQSGDIDQIHGAIADSIDHSLKASLDLELSNSHTDEAAFLYRVDTSKLDVVSRSAVHAALHGNLSQLTALEKRNDGHGMIANGVTLLRSCTKNVRDRKVSLKVNLLGLLNFSSVFELIRQSEVVYEPITGDLTIHETVSGTRIGVLTLPAAHDKLRKIRFNSLLMTSAYRASRSVASMQVTSSDVHFAFNHNTNEHTMSEYLDGLIGLGLVTPAGKAELLAGFVGTGESTYLLRVEFGDAACSTMFLRNGQPRAQAEYERIGRDTMIALLLPGRSNDEFKYRRDVLSSDEIWAKLKAAGQPSFGTVLPGLAHDDVRLNVVKSDYSVIIWWAESMASTGKRLAAVRNFVGAADPATLEKNQTFKSLRDDLQKHVADVVAKSGMQFGLPFGLVALYSAAGAQALPNGIIVSDPLTRVFAPAVPAATV
jgi:hypothetical protein